MNYNPFHILMSDFDIHKHGPFSSSDGVSKNHRAENSNGKSPLKTAQEYANLGDMKNYHITLAKDFLRKNQHQQAAQHFFLGGDLAKAGNIYETIFDYKNAIRSYVKAGQIETAGDLLIRIGERKRAARLYEKAKKYDLAIKYYKETDSQQELIDLYTNTENHFEAFKIAFKMKNIPLAEQFAKKLSKSDINFINAYIYLMVERLEHKDHPKILEFFQTCFSTGTVKFTSQTLTSCAEILESAGLFKQALDVYYMLLNQHTHDADVQTKIRSLEKKFQQSSTLPKLQSYVDRFQLYRKLGTGAMGSVYKARDQLTNQWVALKTLPINQQDEELLRGFLQEGRTAKRLDHPNIVQIYDYGIENDHYFISMEFLEGKTLKEVLKPLGPVNMKNFLSIAPPLANALAYAHQNHIIHRDIKPSNIMLLSNRVVKLMDFGISKLTQFSDHKSIARGTPIYISPEQILGIQTTKQSDLYSLGVVFYEMISGKPPFIEGDILHDHIHKPAEELNKISPDIPFRLVNTIMSCLAKKPDRRPSSAQKIIETLEQIQKEST